MGVFDMLHSFLNPEEGYQKAENASNQAYNEGLGYERPYYQGGLDQYGRLNDATGQLLNPEDLENKWSSGYEMSPYAKRELEMNQGQGLDAASSMGLLGSSGALTNIQRGAGDITSADRQQYMRDLMEKYLAGIGLGKDLYSTGANTAGVMGNQAITHGNEVGGLEYGKAEAPGNTLGKLLGIGGDLALNYMVPGAGGGMTGLARGANSMFGGGANPNNLQGATNSFNA